MPIKYDPNINPYYYGSGGVYHYNAAASSPGWYMTDDVQYDVTESIPYSYKPRMKKGWRLGELSAVLKLRGKDRQMILTSVSFESINLLNSTVDLDVMDANEARLLLESECPFEIVAGLEEYDSSLHIIVYEWISAEFVTHNGHMIMKLSGDAGIVLPGNVDAIPFMTIED